MGLSSWNKIELKIYRLFGINQFRKAIFFIEKVKHYKDKGKNENYHPAGFDVFSIEQYKVFLIYNAFLHCISLLFTAIYLTLSMILTIRNITIDVILIVLSVLNMYCIILQRANYLKIKSYLHKYYKRFFSRTSLYNTEAIQRIYNQEPQKLRNDYMIICRIRNAVEGKSDCILTSSDIEGMMRIAECIEPKLQKIQHYAKKDTEKIKVMDNCCLISGPYSVLQMRADWLQRNLNLSGRKMLGCTAIITEDAECEKLYRNIIPGETRYNMCIISCLLYEVFKDEVDRVRINEMQG